MVKVADDQLAKGEVNRRL